MAPSTPLSYPMAEVTEKVLAFTDASGEGGLGGVFVCQSKQTAPLERGWFSVMSQASGNKLSTELELQAILEVLIRVAQFGQRTGHQVMAVTVCTDSQAAVAAWAKGYSNKSQNITRQLQLIANTCQTRKATLILSWVPRADNSLADALSHPGSDRQLHAAITMEESQASMESLPAVARAFPQG